MAERLVVTGLGAVCALGLTADETWAATRDGRGGIEVTLFDPGPYGPSPHSNPAALVICAGRVCRESR